MKTKLFMLALIISFLTVGVTMMTFFAYAKGPNGPAGKSNIAHLYLYQKDPNTWK